MPYASEVQRRKFHFLLSEGKISPDVVREFDEASKGLTLPERLHPKKEEASAPEQGVYTVKTPGGHPAQRMNQRTEFHPKNVAKIQTLVNLMGLTPGSYHLPLRDRAGNVGGYAVFKAVSKVNHPVLSTVFSKDMRPPGQDIEAMLKTPLKLKFKEQPS